MPSFSNAGTEDDLPSGILRTVTAVIGAGIGVAGVDVAGVDVAGVGVDDVDVVDGGVVVCVDGGVDTVWAAVWAIDGADTISAAKIIGSNVFFIGINPFRVIIHQHIVFLIL